MESSAVDRARKIRLILFDVDGVLTDGGIWLFPSQAAASSASVSQHKASVSSSSVFEAKGFHAHDGAGISLARIGGIKCGIITRRISETVAIRARDLRLDYVYMDQAYKIRAVREILQRESISLEEIAYVGDDVIDLPVMRVCGLAIAVANARSQVKEAAHYITPSAGGHGAGRDAIDFILQAKGILNECIEKYLDEKNPLPASEQVSQGTA